MSLTIFFTKLEPKRVILLWIFSIIVLVTTARTYRAHLYFGSIDGLLGYVNHQVVTRLDSIMFGVLGAFLKYFYPPIWTNHKNRFFVLGITLLLLPGALDQILGHSTIYDFYFSFTVISVGALMLLPKLNEYKSGEGFFHSFFTYTSKISYSMYLVHGALIIFTIMPFLVQFEKNYLGSESLTLNYAVYVIITYVLAALMYKFYESKITNLRERFTSH